MKLTGRIYKEETVDWALLRKLDITQEELERTGQLDGILKGERSLLFERKTVDLDGTKIPYAPFKFQLYSLPGGETAIKFILAKASLQKEFTDIESGPGNYFGYSFTEADRNNLQQTGHLGKTVPLDTPYGDETRKIAHFISVDPDTYTLIRRKASEMGIPDYIILSNGVEYPLIQEQQELLMFGRPAPADNIFTSNGERYDGFVILDAGNPRQVVQLREIPPTMETILPVEYQEKKNRALREIEQLYPKKVLTKKEEEKLGKSAFEFYSQQASDVIQDIFSALRKGQFLESIHKQLIKNRNPYSFTATSLVLAANYMDVQMKKNIQFSLPGKKEKINQAPDT